LEIGWDLRGHPAGVSVWQVENSEVLSAGSVAVAVIIAPGPAATGRIAVKLTWPLPSVVTLAFEPR
jgi:hypothetical protein